MGLIGGSSIAQLASGSNALFVDPVNGNDATAVVGRFDRPFRSLFNLLALYASTPSDIRIPPVGGTIMLSVGTHDLTAGIKISFIPGRHVQGAGIGVTILQVSGAAAAGACIVYDNTVWNAVANTTPTYFNDFSIRQFGTGAGVPPYPVQVSAGATLGDLRWNNVEVTGLINVFNIVDWILSGGTGTFMLFSCRFNSGADIIINGGPAEFHGCSFNMNAQIRVDLGQPVYPPWGRMLLLPGNNYPRTIKFFNCAIQGVCDFNNYNAFTNVGVVPVSASQTVITLRFFINATIASGTVIDFNGVPVTLASAAVPPSKTITVTSVPTEIPDNTRGIIPPSAYPTNVWPFSNTTSNGITSTLVVIQNLGSAEFYNCSFKTIALNFPTNVRYYAFKYLGVGGQSKLINCSIPSDQISFTAGNSANTPTNAPNQSQTLVSTYGDYNEYTVNRKAVISNATAVQLFTDSLTQIPCFAASSYNETDFVVIAKSVADVAVWRFTARVQVDSSRNLTLLTPTAGAITAAQATPEATAWTLSIAADATKKGIALTFTAVGNVSTPINVVCRESITSTAL